MMQDHARRCKMMQDNARQCKMLEDGVRECGAMQDDARRCKMMQDDARQSNMIEGCARRCKMMYCFQNKTKWLISYTASWYRAFLCQLCGIVCDEMKEHVLYTASWYRTSLNIQMLICTLDVCKISRIGKPISSRFVVFRGVSVCKMMQDNARRCKRMQDDAR